MAADIEIRRLTGAGPTSTDISGIATRVSTSDNHYTTETTNPIPIPPSATKYSFWCNTQLHAVTSPTGTINNIKWYTDGTSGFGTGVTTNVATASVYDQASGTAGDTGDQLTVANYGNGTTDLNAEPVEAFANATSGSPLSVSGSISNPTTGAFGDIVVYQLAVINTASAGTLTDETFTWQYDET